MKQMILKSLHELDCKSNEMYKIKKNNNGFYILDKDTRKFVAFISSFDISAMVSKFYMYGFDIILNNVTPKINELEHIELEYAKSMGYYYIYKDIISMKKDGLGIFFLKTYHNKEDSFKSQINDGYKFLNGHDIIGIDTLLES